MQLTMTTLDDIINKQNQQNGIGFNPADLEHSGTKQSQAVQEESKPITTYQDMYEKMNPRPSEAEDEAERKRQRRNAVFAAIGDGLSALSNLYFAGKGAPSSYDPRLSLSAKLQERYDKLNAERRAHDKEWRAGYARAQAMDRQATADRAKDRTTREKLEHQIKIDNERLELQKFKYQVDAEAKEATVEMKQKINDIMINYYNGIISLNEAKTEVEKLKARNGGTLSGSRKPQYDKEVVQSVSVDANGNPVRKTETKFTPSGSTGGSSGGQQKKGIQGYQQNNGNASTTNNQKTSKKGKAYN